MPQRRQNRACRRAGACCWNRTAGDIPKRWKKYMEITGRMRAGRTAPDQSSPKGRIHVLEKGALYVWERPSAIWGTFPPGTGNPGGGGRLYCGGGHQSHFKAPQPLWHQKSMVSYFEHNKEERGELILGRLRAGGNMRAGVGRGHARHLRSGRGAGGILRSGKYSGLRGSRPHGGDPRAGGKRPAHRPVHL